MSLGFAQHLRHNLTDPERKLWSRLRLLRSEGYRFRRQVPFDTYVLDFVSHRERIVVEVDGSHHQDDARQREYDKRRTLAIEESEYIVLRYTNHQVLRGIDWVVRDILEKLEERQRLKFKVMPMHVRRELPAAPSPPTRSGVAPLAVSTAPQRGR